jgi:hypothetical protein
MEISALMSKNYYSPAYSSISDFMKSMRALAYQITFGIRAAFIFLLNHYLVVKTITSFHLLNIHSPKVTQARILMVKLLTYG